MTREANPAEIRVLRALRQVNPNVITGDQMQQAFALLEATENCVKCNGTGNSAPEGMAPGCDRCENTGQQRVIR